jgi:dolichyl-phosphate-mannose-protein mannosyltransferase
VAARRRGAALLLVVTVGLGVRLANLRWMSAQPIATYQFTWGESDMATHWQWAGRILAGDVLGRDTYQPYPSWMHGIAPLETWNRWRGPKVFNKAPLYPYALAGMRALVGDGYPGIGLCQLALGVLNVALVFLLAARFFDTATAVIAGLGAAVYGPFLLYETLVLRDSLAVTVSLLLLLALAHTTAAPAGWALAGAAFALALLGRELVLPFGALVLVWMALRFWGRWTQAARALGAFALGTALGLVPLVARNLAVGAPPLALSAIGLEGIVYGHAVDSAPAAFRLPAATARILNAADGRALEVIRGTLATYEGDWRRLLGNEAARTAAIFSANEGSDNVNWYYFAARSPVLRWSLRWAPVLGLGLVGLWLSRRRVRGDDRIVLFYLATAFAGLQFLPVVGRYRLVPAALLLVYAAVTVRAVVERARERDWRAAARPAVASALLVLTSLRLLPGPDARDRCRTAEYLIGAQVALARNEPDGVYGAFRDGLDCLATNGGGAALPPEFIPFASDFANVARNLGRTTDAAGLLERLAAVYPGERVLPQLVVALRTPRPS